MTSLGQSLLCRGEPLQAVGRDRHLILGRQKRRDIFAQVGIVVDDRHTRTRRRRVGLRAVLSGFSSVRETLPALGVGEVGGCFTTRMRTSGLVHDGVARQVRETLRNLHAERRANTDGAGNLNLSAVQPNELADQRKSDAGSFVGAALRSRDAMESLEDTRQLVLRYPDSAVRDLEDHRSRILGRANGDMPFVGEFECVRERRAIARGVYRGTPRRGDGSPARYAPVSAAVWRYIQMLTESIRRALPTPSHLRNIM